MSRKRDPIAEAVAACRVLPPPPRRAPVDCGLCGADVPPGRDDCPECSEPVAS